MSSHQSFRAAYNFPGNPAIVSNSMNTIPNSSGSGSEFNSDITAYWQGGTGDNYPLTEVEVEDFILNDTSIYLLVSNNRAIWIGGARDLIEDSASRAQFRQGIKLASAAYEICAPRHQNQRFSLISDLLCGRLAATTFAA